MPEYRISEAQYQKFQRKVLAFCLPLLALLVCGFMLVAELPKTGITTAWLIINGLLFLFIASCSRFVIKWALRSLRRTMMSTSIVISTDSVILKEYNTTSRTVNTMEISEIIRTRTGSFWVIGQDGKHILFISHWMDENGELEQELRAFGPITQNNKLTRSFTYRPLLGCLVVIVFFVCLFYEDNKGGKGIVGILAAAFLGWLLYSNLKIKDPTRSDKALSWIMVFFIVAIITMVYLEFIKGLWTK